MLVRERQHKPLRALHDEDGIRTHACRAQWISSPSPDGNTATHREREGKGLDTGDVVPKMASPTMLVSERQHKPLRAFTTRMGFEPTRAEHNGLAVHRLNHSATSSHRGYAIEPDENTATHPEREGMELDTGEVFPKMASPTMLVLRKTPQALEGPSRRGWDSNPRVQSTMD